MTTPHHTKNKGDLGVAKAFERIQVKYRSPNRGTVTVHFRSIWSDRNGTHVRPMEKSEVDVVCVYCPDTDD